MIKEATIVGSGLSGPLLAIFLSKKHKIKVTMYERNSDIRKTSSYAGRSINLALSERGINALKKADVYNTDFEKLLIPMYGRMIHNSDSTQEFQAYGNKKHHYINSVSRSKINKILLSKAESSKLVSINFSTKCTNIDLQKNNLYINEKITPFKGPVFGADGYRSAIAKKVAKTLIYKDIKHGYKELTIKPKGNDFQIDPNALHIWPRKDMMVIALPNNDKSFTCTLFMKKTGILSFDSIKTKKDIFSFFEQNFTDLIDLIPNIDKYFLNNPIGNLISVDVNNWTYNDKACLIGDAAHAIVPFYGQGMNASFEDCCILSEILNEQNSWESTFNTFYKRRKKDADAISELAFKNYDTMKKKVLDQSYIDKYKLGLELNDMFPNYFIPEYTMVSFTNIPFNKVLERNKIQDKILNKILSYDNIPKKEVLEDIVKKNMTKLNCEKDC